MQLGAFSISLAVEDLEASREFYGKLGFEVFHDGSEHNYAILKNGETTIGLFEQMFEKNILTFNPGWDHEANPVDDFTDVRELKEMAEERGLEVIQWTDPEPEGSGPASFVVVDPDGNPILIDQHR